MGVQCIRSSGHLSQSHSFSAIFPLLTLHLVTLFIFLFTISPHITMFLCGPELQVILVAQYCNLVTARVGKLSWIPKWQSVAAAPTPACNLNAQGSEQESSWTFMFYTPGLIIIIKLWPWHQFFSRFTHCIHCFHVGLKFLLFFCLVPLSQYLAYFILLYILCHSPTCMCYALWTRSNRLWTLTLNVLRINFLAHYKRAAKE